MMKNFLMVIVASAAVLFTSCSANDDVIENVQTSSSNAITFNAVNNKTQSTRANLIDDTNELKEANFKIWSYTNNDQEFMDGIFVNWDKTDNGWDYADGNTYYWPTAGTTLNFYAVAPASYANANRKEFTYTVSDEYAFANATQNVDVLFAKAENQSRSNNNGTVSLNFSHILSQIMFNAKTENAQMTATISSIKIHNAATSNTFNFEKGWGTATRNNNTLTVPVKNSAISSSATAITEDSPMLMLPQESTAWNVSGDTKTISGANAANQTYLEITCNVKQNGVDILGSKSEMATIYVPFNATWTAGHKYCYTLIFGGGYDENGDKNNNLTPIQFSVTEVENWTSSAHDIYC